MIWLLADSGSDGQIVALTWVIAVATVVYSAVTIWMALEAKWSREAQTRPSVIAYLQVSSRGNSWPEFVIENVGKASAFQITVEAIDWNLARPYLGSRIEGFLKTPIPYLAPGKQIVCDLSTHTEPGKPFPPGAVRIRVTFLQTVDGSKKLSNACSLSIDGIGFATLEVNSDPVRLLATRVKELTTAIERSKEQG